MSALRPSPLTAGEPPTLLAPGASVGSPAQVVAGVGEPGSRILAGPGRSEAHRCDDQREGPALDGSFTRHELVVALRSLPRRQQEVVVLRYYAGFSEAETATTLGINLGTVKSSGARGLSALAKKLGVEP